MNRFLTVVGMGIVSAGAILLGGLNLGHWLSAPATAPIQGDIIVVLGGSGGYERVGRALDLYRQGYAKEILLAGFHGAAEQRGDLYRHWEAKFLMAGRVPPEALLFDDQSKNSYEEAHNTARLMQSQQWKRALVISDPPHLRRLDMVWGPVCAKHGLEYRLIAAESPRWDPSRWWHDGVWAKFVGMELLKLSYYAIAY
jgi:uncharacterized SAM-binding protein YcdF (DUF218 family)